MGRRSKIVFFNRNDEAKLIDKWNSDSTMVISSYRFVGRKVLPLASPPEMPYDASGLYLGQSIDRPRGLCILNSSALSQLTFYPILDKSVECVDEFSKVIRLSRLTYWKDKMVFGELVMNLPLVSYQDSMDQELKSLWNKVQHWLKKTCVMLPENGGYIAPNAMEEAASGKRIFGLRRLYTVSKDFSGTYQIDSRLLTKHD